MTTTADLRADARKAVASYVVTHTEASHRQLARALGVSASTIDRTCRQLRGLTHAQCPHGQPGAGKVTQVDAPVGTSASVRQGNVIQLRQRRDSDALSPAVAAAVDAPTVAVETRTPDADALVPERWRCDSCAAGGQTGDRCGACGWPARKAYR
jgi:hypothetical protein